MTETTLVAGGSDTVSTVTEGVVGAFAFSLPRENAGGLPMRDASLMLDVSAPPAFRPARALAWTAISEAHRDALPRRSPAPSMERSKR